MTHFDDHFDDDDDDDSEEDDDDYDDDDYDDSLVHCVFRANFCRRSILYATQEIDSAQSQRKRITPLNCSSFFSHPITIFFLSSIHSIHSSDSPFQNSSYFALNVPPLLFHCLHS